MGINNRTFLSKFVFALTFIVPVLLLFKTSHNGKHRMRTVTTGPLQLHRETGKSQSLGSRPGAHVHRSSRNSVNALRRTLARRLDQYNRPVITSRLCSAKIVKTASDNLKSRMKTINSITSWNFEPTLSIILASRDAGFRNELNLYQRECDPQERQ